jgi:hypothetical protein
MTLHRTSIHHQVLGMVRDGRVSWRPAEVPQHPCRPARSAGFVHLSGGHLELSVLWELRQHDLITVDGGSVSLSKTGEARLSEWDDTRVGRS